MSNAIPQPSRAQPLAERVFTDEDQQWFALMSGDRNPMHLDPTAARRMLTGRPVVHGVHLLLWSIEHWRRDEDAQVATIACTFDNPVSVGDKVRVGQRIDRRGRVVLTASVDDVQCVRTVITTVPEAGQPDRRPSAERLAGDAVHRLDEVARPLDQTPESHLGKVYSVAPSERGLCDAFPRACGILGQQGLPAAAALSYFAGMIAPGLHSVLSAITLDLAPQPSEGQTLFLTVRKYHSNFRLFDIAFEGSLNGRLEAFLKHPPHRQPSMIELASLIGADEFRGTRSLIVGGSRGLGELTAKLLAAGGGEVDLTYRSGQDDANRVRDEINGSHAEAACQALPFDVTADGWERLTFNRREWDAVYFFPTPRIFRNSAAVFSPERFAEFSDVYIKAFFALCKALEGRSGKPVRVFFPSSVAVVDRPKGLTEYSMVKAAAEVLIEDINRSFTHVSVVSSRLPRLSTDQTESIQDVPAESNVDTLLPIIRSMYQPAS